MTQILSQQQSFEEIKKSNQQKKEFWLARDPMSVLGYSKWQNFEIVIKKAKKSCQVNGENVENHFTDIGKMTIVEGDTSRIISDWELDRCTCYQGAYLNKKLSDKPQS